MPRGDQGAHLGESVYELDATQLRRELGHFVEVAPALVLVAAAISEDMYPLEAWNDRFVVRDYQVQRLIVEERASATLADDTHNISRDAPNLRTVLANFIAR
tara:strand:+ start:1141 stop:1446 length:306 start_codon:yes stop_codon:yes gene_type:complete